MQVQGVNGYQPYNRKNQSIGQNNRQQSFGIKIILGRDYLEILRKSTKEEKRIFMHEIKELERGFPTPGNLVVGLVDVANVVDANLTGLADHLLRFSSTFKLGMPGGKSIHVESIRCEVKNPNEFWGQ